MFGYLDLNKDCGYFMVNWVFFKVQDDIVWVCCEYDVCVMFFYGCGGSIVCGGGLVVKVILVQLVGFCDGGICVMEQGEVLFMCYYDLDFVYCIFEQMVYGVLLGVYVVKNYELVFDVWLQVMEKMLDVGVVVYKVFVYDDFDFFMFWKQFMFIDEISNLKFGLCLIFCCNMMSVEDLCVILWVFLWMQSCFVFLGWFGLGVVFDLIFL